MIRTYNGFDNTSTKSKRIQKFKQMMHIILHIRSKTIPSSTISQRLVVIREKENGQRMSQRKIFFAVPMNIVQMPILANKPHINNNRHYRRRLDRNGRLSVSFLLSLGFLLFINFEIHVYRMKSQILFLFVKLNEYIFVSILSFSAVPYNTILCSSTVYSLFTVHCSPFTVLFVVSFFFRYFS